MREETEYRPKPLVTVGGKPLLWHIMKLFSAHECTEFICCLGYRGAMIKEYFLDYRALSTDMTVSLATGTVEQPPARRSRTGGRRWRSRAGRSGTGCRSRSGERLPIVSTAGCAGPIA